MHIHILGICGTFMGGLAALASQAGHTVTGCDAGVYPPMSEQLRALGIGLIEGYGADQLALRPDLYVVGNVVSRTRLADGAPKFPLMEAVMDAGLPYASGPQWLAEHVLQGRHVIAVAGTHGKTTTTAMLAWILERAGLTPGFLIGGVPLGFDISARLGGNANSFLSAAGPSQGAKAPSGGSAPCAAGKRGGFFVIEADEYDTAFFDKRSKFIHYRPRTAVLNNLEFDHADIFPDLAAIERQFHHLVRTVPRAGRIVVNAGSAALARVLAQGCWSEQARFGAAADADVDFAAQGDPGDFAVLQREPDGLREAGRVRWNLTGAHNQMNALAAIAAARHAGVDPAAACAALSAFAGVRRRMEVRGSAALPGGGAVTVYDDFAHHPSAIRATVDGLRQRLDAQGRRSERILAVFEPRSNTMKLGSMKGQLPWALEHADLAFCHAAGLDWDAAQVLAPLGARAQVAHPIDTLVAQVAAAARAGDHILCMSNGSFGGVHGKLLAALQKRV
ncbi:MAG: UDP-N-acetylmuramate:L-alanyl-gamma-D-glutamyl-meso-diaminopimelate ligase [Burkholderiaceae bacterium]|jgi:UDP-N-acetylmuramate: L-alanyl-gamma-D-glutamyl-meso-diaminopimelate ligase|nr:UDP-N-acetylmuramate:L-alanyl-gamma-D-glutamyl-meso-diaminopimelate ligase [Burkholderiaceae bacterium]